VTNITFIFEISPNTKPQEKKVGGHGILCPPVGKSGGGHVPRVPHQIAPTLDILKGVCEEPWRNDTNSPKQWKRNITKFTFIHL